MRKMVYVLLVASRMLVAGDDTLVDGIKYIETELNQLAALQNIPESCIAITEATGHSPGQIAQAKKQILLDLMHKFDDQEISHEQLCEQFESDSYDIFKAIPVVVTESGKPEVAYRIPFEGGTYKLQLLNSKS